MYLFNFVYTVRTEEDLLVARTGDNLPDARRLAYKKAPVCEGLEGVRTGTNTRKMRIYLFISIHFFFKCIYTCIYIYLSLARQAAVPPPRFVTVGAFTDRRSSQNRRKNEETFKNIRNQSKNDTKWMEKRRWNGFGAKARI